MTEQEQEEARPHVEVWQQPNGEWRWRYVEQHGEERVELPSNEPDSTCDEAVHKASIAYPGLTIVVTTPPRDDPEEGHGPSGRPRPRRRGRGRRVVLLLVGAVVVVVLVTRRVRRLSRPPR